MIIIRPSRPNRLRSTLAIPFSLSLATAAGPSQLPPSYSTVKFGYLLLPPPLSTVTETAQEKLFASTTRVSWRFH
jgi:hypothetical protein